MMKSIKDIPWECGKGWWPMIEKVASAIDSFNANHPESPVEVSQIKQKFGGLRIYHYNAPEDLRLLIDNAVTASWHTCEKCGSTAGVTTNLEGYRLTLCPECRKGIKPRNLTINNTCVVQYKYCFYLCKKTVMTFDKILDDKRLWAVKYDGEKANCFDQLFSTWYDMNWLRSFFQENLADLSSYFHITDVYEAVMETIDEAKRLECVMMDITPDANLDLLFKHLENSRFSEMTLGREKAYGAGGYRHQSWLRIYAIKIEPGVYLVTGGAIKLTATMEERRHTMEELAKLERVRNYLLDNGVYDLNGFNDYVDNEQGN